ncbi:MAG: hypothetical protein HC803_09605 [Saprospiraceae bacterium]|nr:hypothetical protein [Saprospiraceae bacterium]
MKENSEEFKKYANEGGKEKIIIIKNEDDEEGKVMNSENGKKVIIIKEENKEEIIIDGEGKQEMDINVDVSEVEDGIRVIKIKKKGKDGQEEVEEFILDNMGDGEEIIKTNDGEKVIIKVKKDIDFDLDDINPDDIEKVNVIKRIRKTKS